MYECCVCVYIYIYCVNICICIYTHTHIHTYIYLSDPYMRDFPVGFSSAETAHPNVCVPFPHSGIGALPYITACSTAFTAGAENKRDTVGWL